MSVTLQPINMNYKPLDSSTTINKIDKNRDKDKCYASCLRYLRLNNTQNLILIIVLTFMFFVITKQVSALIRKQQYHNGKYFEIDDQLNLEGYKVIWDQSTVEFFHKNLGLNDGVKVSPENTIECDPGKEFFIMGLQGPEEKLEDYVWQILSLTAISSQIYYSNNNDVIQLRPFTTETTIANLNKLFTE